MNKNNILVKFYIQRDQHSLHHHLSPSLACCSRHSKRSYNNSKHTMCPYWLSLSFTRYASNKYLRRDPSGPDVEWGYAFDIHINAFFPPLSLLHCILMLFFSGKYYGNTFALFPIIEKSNRGISLLDTGLFKQKY